MLVGICSSRWDIGIRSEGGRCGALIDTSRCSRLFVWLEFRTAWHETRVELRKVRHTLLVAVTSWTVKYVGGISNRNGDTSSRDLLSHAKKRSPLKYTYRLHSYLQLSYSTPITFEPFRQQQKKKPRWMSITPSIIVSCTSPLAISLLSYELTEPQFRRVG